MSGPKSYIAPPRYSINVFNGKLNEVFQIQSEIKLMIDELKGLTCDDTSRKIKFDCANFIETNHDLIKNSLTSFTINHQGTFEQKVYDKFDRQISGKIKQLKSFLDNIKEAKKEFRNKEEDYQAYIEYEKFLEHSIDAFQSYKVQVVKYLKNYLEKDYIDLFREAEKSIVKINCSIEKSMFDFGFRDVRSSKKDEIKNDVGRCESKINIIRTDLSNKVLDKIGDNEQSLSKQISSQKKIDQKTKTDIQTQIEKINSYVSEVNDQKRQDKYQQKLNNLMKSSSFKDVYFYVELSDEIKESEKVFSWKTEIQNLVADLNKIQIHEDIKKEKRKLVQFGISLIEKERIKSYEFEDFQTQLTILKEKNQKFHLEDSIKEKERLFLKSQLIKSLEGLNYEVIDDMQVIDFEKESDFIFKIPSQSNYLNLRFQHDGSFLYNFLIPQKREDLSIDQKEQKLSEMETTCKEFQNLLMDLGCMGLKIELKSEKPISEQYLISIPKKYQEKIKTKIGQKKKKSQKEKLLK